MNDVIKICKKHGQLTIDNIQKRKGSSCVNCKICAYESKKISKKKHIDSIKIKDKEYKLINREKIKAKTREYDQRMYPAKKAVRYRNTETWRKNNPDKWRNLTLRRRFGINLEIYNKMLIDQNYVCNICNKPEKSIFKKTKKLKNLAVDHCHATGIVRGLLCSACNTAIGHFQDSPQLLINAEKYLRKNK